MADESVELEIELKDGISAPSKRAAKALQNLAEQAERTQTRMIQKISRSSVKSTKMRLGREYAAAKESALLGKRSQQITKLQGDGFDQLTRKVGTFAGGIGYAAAALAPFAAMSAGTAYGAAKLGGALFESARDAGQLKTALALLTGNDGAKELEGITKLAVDLGLEAKDTADAYLGLLKMRFDPAAAKEWVKFGADMQSLGNNAEDVQGILLAVSQIKAAGKLEGDELRQLTERGVSREAVYDEIRKRKGLKNNSEVIELQKAGGIDSDTALAAIQAATLTTLHTDHLGQAAEQYVKTFAGSMTKGEAEFSRVGLGLGSAFERGFAGATADADRMKKAGFTGMSTQAGVGGFFEQMQNSPTIAKLGDFVEKLGNGFARLLPFVLQVGEAFVSGFADGSWLDTFGDEDTITGFAAILRDDIVPAAKTVGSVLGWITSLTLAMTAGFAYATAGLVNFVTGIADGAVELVASFIDLGARAVDGFIEGLSGGWQRTKDAVGKWTGGIIGTSEKDLEVHSPSKAFYRIGKYSSQGMQEGMDSITPQLPGADAMAPAPGSFSGGGSNVFNVNINVDGSKDPAETARMIRIEFETLAAGMFGRFAEGVA